MNKEIDKQQNLHNRNSVLRGQVRENILITQIEDHSFTATILKEEKLDNLGKGAKNKRVIVRVIDFDFIF